MRSRHFCILLCICFLSSGLYAQKQQNRWWNQIQEIKKRDSISFPPENSIVFVGSSTIGLWKNLQETFKKYNVLKRGFGGSQLNDMALFADDIVIAYKPRQVIIYGGDNDLPGESVTADTIYNRFLNVYNKIRNGLPHVPIAFISIKPSPSREKFMAKASEANRMIRAFLADQPLADYIDVYSLMLDSTGKPKADLFKNDKLHMNEQGYALWVKTIEPYLLKP